METSLEVLSWIRSRNIAWVKSGRNGANHENNHSERAGVTSIENSDHADESQTDPMLL